MTIYTVRQLILPVLNVKRVYIVQNLEIIFKRRTNLKVHEHSHSDRRTLAHGQTNTLLTNTTSTLTIAQTHTRTRTDAHVTNNATTTTVHYTGIGAHI